MARGISNLLAMANKKGKAANCERHGEYTAFEYKIPGRDSVSWSECPSCFQEKRRAEDRQMVRDASRNANALRLEKMLGHAAIPARYKRCNFDSYVMESEGQRKAVSAARRYASDFKENLELGRCLMMVGDPGTGKTHLSAAIAMNVIDQGYSAVYVTMNEVIDAVIESYGERGKRHTLNNFRQPDLLILDEVGRQKGTDHDRSIMFELISRRYDDMKPTLLVTNLDLEELKQYLDRATRDRLRDNDGRVIVFDWDSFRG